MDVGLASGGLAKAALAVSAGMCNVAVLFWGKAGWQLGPRGTQVPDRAPRVEEFSWQLAGDGGYAIVVASEEVARNCRSVPVWVLGGAEAAYTDAYTTIDVPWFPEDGKAVRRTADMAFSIAGVSRRMR